MRSFSNLNRLARAVSSYERQTKPDSESTSGTVHTSTGCGIFDSNSNGTVEDPMKSCLALALCARALFAQQTTVPPLESIVVTGTAEPLPLAEADRDVSVVRLPEKQRELYNSSLDLLQFDPALDLQQRSGGAMQADVSIRGASFGQTLVLLNGLRVNDVQTGHFNLDLPVPIEMLTD